MVVSKVIELLGTKSLQGCTGLILYNTNSFKDPLVCENLGLSATEANRLSTEPTLNTIQSIRRSLSAFSEFEPLSLVPSDDLSEELLFVFDNNKLNVINGHGFNTMIFLSGESSIIGFIVLLNPVGAKRDDSSKTNYDLKRNYTLHNIKVSIDASNSQVRIDQDIVHLLNDVETLARAKKRDYSGEKNYNFITKAELDSSRFSESNYTKYVSVLLKSNRPKSIFLDTLICNSSRGQVNLSVLNIKRNLELDNNYADLNEAQVGYFEGDIALFLWSNEIRRYSVISLTKTMDSIFGKAGQNIPWSYLTPLPGDKFSTNIHGLPPIETGKNATKIEYFAGRYAVASLNGKRYLFDIKDRYWIKYKNTETKEYEFLNEFVVDSLDPFGKIYRPDDKDNGLWDWRDYQKAVEKLYSVSETYIDSGVSMISQAKYPIRKIGDWVVFSNENSKVYSNMTKSLTLSFDENDPIVLNDQTLLTWKNGIDEEGRSTVTYHLYDKAGYFISHDYKSRTGIQKDLESRNKNYKVNDDALTLRTSSVNSNFADSPVLIQRSFFSLYRRNILPKTLEKFSIIGAFKGLIFYRVGNTINYL